MQKLKILFIFVFSIYGFHFSNTAIGGKIRPSTFAPTNCLFNIVGIPIYAPQPAKGIKGKNAKLKVDYFFRENFRNTKPQNGSLNSPGRVSLTIKKKIATLAMSLENPKWLLDTLETLKELDGQLIKFKDIPALKPIADEAQQILDLYFISIGSFIKHAYLPLIAGDANCTSDCKAQLDPNFVFSFASKATKGKITLSELEFDELSSNDPELKYEDDRIEVSLGRVLLHSYFSEQLRALVMTEKGETEISKEEATNRLRFYIENTAGQGLIESVKQLVAMLKSSEFRSSRDSFDILDDVWNNNLFATPRPLNPQSSGTSQHQALSNIKSQLQLSKALLVIFNYRMTIYHKNRSIRNTSPASVLYESMLLLEKLIRENKNIADALDKLNKDVFILNNGEIDNLSDILSLP